MAPPKAAAATDSATALKRQRGKAKKKEVPARIISLPVEKPPAPASVAPAMQPAGAERASGIPARSEARRGQAGDARGQGYGAGGQAGGRSRHTAGGRREEGH